ncbi:ARID/BRIGHT DNA binding domain-containing protein [Chloropicon primus]|uniref:SHSP domain-containing protein n=1 Tax=Chloropicon primus TaxID=1764295 RepID=A0A5B8MK90_9CHLO|nr:hypothetical protein A3770_04p30120 [Chloropicon primus]UPQ99704.1 ARID/BRIGHT DNA binding domain-containing protein [Chloropicon primus]|eukprot:QDZ20494.1 hypothetical protein A3770_04p30120 [Chloropicon primus]
MSGDAGVVAPDGEGGDAVVGEAIREVVERETGRDEEQRERIEQRYLALNQLQGTPDPFATALWRFWVSQHGPGWQDHKVLKCPLSIAKKPLDLELLWCEVNKRGGWEKVNATKMWSKIGKLFNPPPTCTNLSFITKKCYTEVLLPLEIVTRHEQVAVPGITLPATEAALLPEPRTYGSYKRHKSTGAVYGAVPKGARDYGEEIVGRQVKVFFKNLHKSFAGEVVKYDEEKSLHLIRYADGEEKWTDFKKERKWSFVSERLTRHALTAEREGPAAAEAAAAAQATAQAALKDADLLGSPYGEAVRVEKTTHQVPLVDESHNHTGVTIKVTNRSQPQMCGITQVEQAEDGFEIYALLPGLTLDDVSVSCSSDGKVVIEGNPKDSYTSDEVGLQPVHQTLQLPTKLQVDKTVAILTLHGLLYVKVHTL